MIIDLDQIQDSILPKYDVCIVGSGPAGITIANELKSTDIRVCIVESGKKKPTKHGDALRRVQSDGIHVKDFSRERVLGGASTTWAGLSSPLDPIDMEPRKFLQASGWPIMLEELSEYYAQASERYRFAPLDLYKLESYSSIKERGDVQLTWENAEEKIFLASSEAQNFGREFSDCFETENIDLYLDATLVGLLCAKSEQIVRTGIIRTSKMDTFHIDASIFVVSAGGIENARILLNCKDLCPEGLGNEYDQVGRYFMNHLKGNHGVIRLKRREIRRMPYYFGCLYKGYAVYVGLRLKESLQHQHGYLNAYVRWKPVFPWSKSRGVNAFVYLIKHLRVIFKLWKNRYQHKIIPLRSYEETGDDSEFDEVRKTAVDWMRIIGLILVNLPQVGHYLYYRLRNDKSPRSTEITFRNFMEMEPDPENRVLLGSDLDIFGQPIPIVRHRPSDRDKKSLIALHQVLSQEFQRNGLGDLETSLSESDPWPIDLDASHHLGTTRMGRNPESSVVNLDCRLHTVENVYLAGGSVFPTSGCANPTYTIVALSIRLAKHLRAQYDAVKPERIFNQPS